MAPLLARLALCQPDGRDKAMQIKQLKFGQLSVLTVNLGVRPNPERGSVSTCGRTSTYLDIF